MKSIFFIVCLLNACILNTTLYTAQKENISYQEKRYFDLRQAREKTFLPEVAQTYKDLQANPDSSELQEAFTRYKIRLDGCDAAMLKLRKQTYPQPLLLQFSLQHP